MQNKQFDFSKRIYLDGAFGTQLFERGIQSAPDIVLTDEDSVFDIHRAYLERGVNVVTTASFSANRLKTERFAEVAVRSIEIAKKAAERYGAKVAYDCGPLGVLLQPFGELSFDAAYEYFAEQARAVKGKGADFILLETFSELSELRAAILAFSESCDLPIWCSMTFEEGTRSFTGCDVSCFARMAQALGVQAVGVNCGVGPDKIAVAVAELIKHTDLPVFVQPNAGLPVYREGRAFYELSADEYASYMKTIARMGVSILGGCCGTTPEHIERMRALTADIPVKHFARCFEAVCCADRLVELKPTVVVGERINPTGKPKLKAALLSGNDEYAQSLCFEQLADGAQILDVNVGMSGIDETERLVQVTEAVQSVAGVPLQIDTSRGTALERAVRRVAGVPLINSVNAEESSLSTVLPIAQKYGCYVVCLPLDENGIPSTAEGRLKLAKKIENRANLLGIPTERLVFDGLTMAVSVNGDNAKITLDTIRAMARNGYKTCLGLSNVSFGLPAREKLNATFFAQAIEAGLTLAIVNPSTKPLKDSLALAVLNGSDANAQAYIEAYSNVPKAPAESAQNLSLRDCVLRGLRREGAELARSQVTAENSNDILERQIIPALEELGEQYENKQAFLPQLIAGSEAAKSIIEVLSAATPKGNGKSGVPMLILTVKGDVHDIGKNIVKTVLENYGFDIVDLGKSVSTETVMEAIEKTHPKVIGLSALMTTTLDNLKETVRAVQAKYPEILLTIGGAVVTQAFADELGVTYGKDANDTASKLKKYVAEHLSGK